MNVIQTLLQGTSIPQFHKIYYQLDSTHLTDIAAAVRQALSRPDTLDRIRPGSRVCFTGSSREIANAALILRTIAEEIKRIGAHPVLIPAMGSHAGATAEGQKNLLAHYGITEESIRCPIYASMETVEIGKTEDGHSVHIDAFAAKSDFIIPVGRIKAHTQFHGPVESGILKMITIGLGKQHGANLCHQLGMRAMGETMPRFARVSLANCPIPFGIGIIENGLHQTHTIAAIPAEKIETEEAELLLLAKKLMPSFPYDKIDILIVEQMGKDISGDGMDPNIIGRDFFDRDMRPHFERIGVFRLTEKTGGNFYGLSLADVVTRTLFERVSFAETYPNFITNMVPQGAMIPPVLDSDQLCVQACIATCVNRGDNWPRIAWIRDTLHLDSFFVSEGLYHSVPAPGYSVTFESRPYRAVFDKQGTFEAFHLI